MLPTTLEGEDADRPAVSTPSVPVPVVSGCVSVVRLIVVVPGSALAGVSVVAVVIRAMSVALLRRSAPCRRGSPPLTATHFSLGDIVLCCVVLRCLYCYCYCYCYVATRRREKELKKASDN